jgi:hypothetical protein
LVALTILVILYAGLGCLPIAWAAVNIGGLAKAIADAAGQGKDPGQVAADNMAGICSGLGVIPDWHNFHKGGTITVSVTCNVPTPWFGWFGLHDVDLGSTATSPIVVDQPHRFTD